ncbi:transcriptional regulator, TetR family [Colwellia chukchiensis]|uniref:Transcriptional regulator, TetR family n=1 Tax=Colwellia chukchiensis TaxID=641665 RepID=A0A1H7HYP7_9GAMM|nr:TetR family transcriptional regulator C-terminal domain-containing protein [Colwellia chukchiensis]SEK55401.1 transcriptional regulator, TetR family [Colwellia chukchiensis]
MEELYTQSARTGARLSPEERRSALINATLRCIIKEGHAGLSVRKVCQEAGVSAGLLTHHFTGKEELIIEAYRFLTKDIYSRINQSLAQVSEPSALKKLRLFIDVSFRRPVLDKDYLMVWLVFWGLSKQKPAIAVLRNEVNDTVISTLEKLMTATVSELSLEAVNVRLAATGLSALMDGLWLEWSLNSTNFSPDEAAKICQCWVDAFVANALQRLN